MAFTNRLRGEQEGIVAPCVDSILYAAHFRGGGGRAGPDCQWTYRVGVGDIQLGRKCEGSA